MALALVMHCVDHHHHHHSAHRVIIKVQQERTHRRVCVCALPAWLTHAHVHTCTPRPRLLLQLHSCERHLTFWEQQMQHSGPWAHFQFMLLCRGPVAFGGAVAAALGLAEQDELNATDKIQQRVRGTGKGA